MSWEVTTLILGVLVSGTAAWGMWLRSRAGSQLAVIAELVRRLERVEAEVRNVALRAPVAVSGTGPRSLYGGK